MPATKTDRAEQVRQLEQAVRDVLADDGFARWAQVRRSFHHYSFSNQLLIVVQRPDACRVAGYRKWLELGRQVKKGEHAIRIWAPRVRKVEGDDGEEVRITGFVLVPVFDVGQTEGDPLPESPARDLASSDYPDALRRLEKFGQDELGYSIEYVDSLGGPLGCCDLKNKRIQVVTRAVDDELRTLAHELAHAHGIDYHDFARDRAEVIVEAAASLALATLGLDTAPASLPYIAAWSSDGDGLKALKTDLGEIDRIATALEGALLGEERK